MRNGSETSMIHHCMVLHGNPGSGKTESVLRAASRLGIKFKHIMTKHVLSKMVGGSEDNLSQIFEEAARNQPYILFFDEFEIMGGRRDGCGPEADMLNVLRAEFLQYTDKPRFDGMPACGVFVVGCTNYMNLLDESVISRMRGLNLAVPIPSMADRKIVWANVLLASRLELPLQSDGKLDQATFDKIVNRAAVCMDIGKS